MAQHLLTKPWTDDDEALFVFSSFGLEFGKLMKDELFQKGSRSVKTATAMAQWLHQADIRARSYVAEQGPLVKQGK